MDVRLPLALRAAIEDAAAGLGGMGEAARRLSSGYREHRNSSALVTSEADAVAYALARLPATFAAALAALTALAEARPDFVPRSLADLGAGPGTASFAALALWPDIVDITLIERNRRFLDLAARIAGGADGAFASSRRVERDLAHPGPLLDRPTDLAVLAYTLTELDEALSARIITGLIEAGASYVVVVEPGTPRDHARLMRLRDVALVAGARVLAPCPHQRRCPLPADDWCHFAVRLPRSRQHLHLKDARVPFEDEPFSYLVLAGPGVAEGTGQGARILRRPVTQKPGISLRLCRADGSLAAIEIARRDGDAYRRARRVDWGDIWGDIWDDASRQDEADGPD